MLLSATLLNPGYLEAHQKHNLRARQGLLQRFPTTRVGLDDLSAQVDELLRRLRVGVASNDAGLEGAVLEDGVEDGGA